MPEAETGCCGCTSPPCCCLHPMSTVTGGRKGEPAQTLADRVWAAIKMLKTAPVIQYLHLWAGCFRCIKRQSIPMYIGVDDGIIYPSTGLLYWCDFCRPVFAHGQGASNFSDLVIKKSSSRATWGVKSQWVFLSLRACRSWAFILSVLQPHWKPSWAAPGHTHCSSLLAQHQVQLCTAWYKPVGSIACCSNDASSFQMLVGSSTSLCLYWCWGLHQHFALLDECTANGGLQTTRKPKLLSSQSLKPFQWVALQA